MANTVVRRTLLLFVAAAAAAVELPAQSREPGPDALALEFRLGVVSNPGALGHTSQVEPEGYFSLGGPDPAPSLGLAVVLPPTLLGLRPVGRLSWKEFGEPGGIFLPEGAQGETEPLVKGGLSAALSSGGWELVTRVEAGLGRHGPGIVDAVQPTPDSPPTIDLGRKTLTEYTVSMGIRRGIR